MTLLYLVRHGETDWNLARRVQGSTDIPLNAMGRSQAHATGRLLASREWDVIIASPLSRAFETATIIAGELALGEVTPNAAFMERHYGAAEGLDHDAIDSRFPGDTPVPGRESRDEVTARVLPALMDVAEAHRGRSILVVSHGGVIRSVLNAVDPHGAHGSIRNGSVHSFRYVDGEFQLIAFDDPIEDESLDVATDELEVQNALESRTG
ncbi:phosphatase PhoE [soil metagenome]